MLKYVWMGLFLVLFSCSQFSSSTIVVKPRAATSSVENDADDCAIWMHPNDSSLSVIIGNDKGLTGCLYVWDLDGKLVYKTSSLLKPTHVDLRYGMKVDGENVDIVVCALRSESKLKVFKIDPTTRFLIDITTEGGINTLLPYDSYGLCLYKNPLNGKIYAFVTPKEPDSDIHQLRLEDDGTGKVKGTLVRAFGALYKKGLLEGLYADDELGYLYCSDSDGDILKFYADPDEDKDLLVSRFAVHDGIKGDRQGITLYKCTNDRGYLIVSSQGNSTLKIYDRKDGNEFVGTVIKHGSVKTAGIAATSCSAGPYKYGFVVCHNEKNDNFVIYDWSDIAVNKLQKCHCPAPY